MSFLDLLRELLRKWSMSLSGVNAAVASGKALDLLRQKIVGRYSVKDITLRDIGSHDCDKPVLNILIESYEPLTEHSRFLIEHQMHLVNERFGTGIRMHLPRGYVAILKSASQD